MYSNGVVTWLLTIFIIEVVLLALPGQVAAQDINLTPEQMAQLQGMTSLQRQEFLESLGMQEPASAPQVQLTQPVEVVPRDVESVDGNPIEESTDELQAADSLAENPVPQDTGQDLEQFGYDLFAGTPTTFAPATDIPVPANYVIGPGDTVIIQLYGQQNVTYELVVTRDGILLLPEIGPVSVAGLSFSELRDQIDEIVATQLIGQRASVTLGSLRSIRIFVLGEAFRPGSYTVSGLSTMTNALFVSGGITTVGSLRNVQLRRQGETVSTLDLYDLLLRGDTSADQRLMPDDVLFIPPIGPTVAVAGEVIRPAIYELKDETTALDAVMLAGGLLPTAYTPASKIERIDELGTRTVIDVDLSSPIGQVLDVINGDLLQVNPVLDRLENVVLTEGHLERPGGFQWREGLRVSDLIPSLDVMLPNPDTSYALVVREVPPTSTLEVHRVELASALANPDTASDLLLEPRDRLITFAANGNRQQALSSLIDELNAQARFERPAALVTIQGNVRFPGTYPLLQGMTIADLVESASGLLEQTDTQLSLLVRRRDSQGNIEVVNAIDQETRSLDFDRFLQPGDSLLVFSAVGSRVELLGPVLNQLVSQSDSLERSRVVTVSGQVKFPGRYPLFEGMVVEDLIQVSGGFTESALTTSAELTRFYVYEESGREIDHLEVDLTNSSSRGRQLGLEEFDNLVVRQLPNWTDLETITLSGEVVSPGTYTIAKGDTLSSVLLRAGGITQFADPKAGVFTRDELRQREAATLQRYERELENNLAALALEQEGNQSEILELGTELLDEVGDAQALGRLVVDLPLILNGSEYDDVIVRNGDQLFIPRTRQEISILGEVNYPTSHLFDPDLSVADYIELSGGTTELSDAGRTYVIKANGKVVAYGDSRWFFEPDMQLEPGDTIIVPFDLRPTDYLRTWTSVSQILFGLATSVLAIESVSN